MASNQAKVFAVTAGIALITEIAGEIALYGIIPEDNRVIKTRFWAQFVVGAAISLFFTGIGYIATDCIAKKGWSKTAWLVAIVPMLPIVTGGFVLHGVDTVLGSSSGTGSVALIKAAFAAKKKKSTQGKK